jgi:hypothetical protein
MQQVIKRPRRRRGEEVEEEELRRCRGDEDDSSADVTDSDRRIGDEGGRLKFVDMVVEDNGLS